LIIHELHIKGFGKWRNATFRFTPGLNLVAAANEAGKTTLLHALFASLYGLKRDYVRVTRYLDEYAKYLPWDGGPYETIVRYRLAGQTFRLHRCLEKEREQAKLYLDPELVEVTRQYQEDRRKEYNFLERHLGLTRSLFTDVAWVRREPLQSAEYLLPSLAQTNAVDPAVSLIAAGIEQEIAQIGRKETAESTLLGKAAKRVAQTQQALADAEQAWLSARHLTQSIMEWQAELAQIEKRQRELQMQLQAVAQAEQEWQLSWELTFQLNHSSQLEQWEARAANGEESELHRRTKQELAAIERRLAAPGTLPERKKQPIDTETLQADYAKGRQLLKALEEKKESIYRLAASLSREQSVSRSEESRRARNASAGRSKGNVRARAAYAAAALSALAAGIGFWLGHAAAGIAGVTAALAFVLLAALPQRRSPAVGLSGMTEAESVRQEQLRQEHGKLEAEAEKLKDDLQALLRRWNVADWEAFEALRERYVTSAHREEAERLAAELADKREKERIIAHWAEHVRQLLQEQKADLANRRGELEQRQRENEEQIVHLRERIARAGGEIGRHDQFSWAKAKSEYDDAVAAMEQLLQKREALLLARETLRAALQEWQRDISPDINRFASEIIGHITGGAYRDVRLDATKEFAVRVIEPERQNVLEHQHVSTGTQDQLYFAQRIALLRYVSAACEPLPLFLDDHFIHYDESRLARTLDYLLKLSEQHQVFLFSCQEREKRLLESALRDNPRHTVHCW
jgi:DNA repair exonuclease SbcCD ATPase subunit